MINKIEITPSGNCLTIQSQINSDVFNNVCSEKLEIIKYLNYKPNEKDLKIINNYFKTNKKPRLEVENYHIPFLPEAEKFSMTRYNEEAIDLLKNNTVRKLTFWYGPEDKKKLDLTKLLIFKDTLEELCFREGNYKNLEITINGLKNLKALSLEKLKIDFSLIEHDSLEYFFHFGSKTADWSNAANFKKLRHCTIWTNHKIETLDFLQKMTNLEYIELDQCSKITHFPNLEHLKNLRKIVLSGNKRLDDSVEVESELKKLKNLKNVKNNFEDGYYDLIEWSYHY